MCHVNVCVGAAQQQQRAGQWVRSCAALAPITPPSVHQCSLSFCSPFYPLLPTPCVFIRLVGALSTVTLLLILMVMTAESLSPPAWHLVQIWRAPFQVFVVTEPIIIRPWCQLSVSEHRLGLWPQIVSVQTLSLIVSFLFFSLSPFLLLAWLTACLGFTGVGLLLIWSSVCFWIPHLISCQHSDWPRSVCSRLALRQKALPPLLTLNAMCTCVQWHKAPFLLVIILSGGSCTDSSYINYSDYCSHYTDNYYFEQGSKTTLGIHGIQTHKLPTTWEIEK